MAKATTAKLPPVKVDLPALLDKIKGRGGTPGLLAINVAQHRVLSEAAAQAVAKDKVKDEGLLALVQGFCKGADGLEGTHPKREVYVHQDQAYQLACLIEGIPEGSHNSSAPPAEEAPPDDQPTAAKKAKSTK